ncbi:GAF domain-containing protein [Prauserella cavernicola]|uniref:GAF domain-containing protein n=1 Tax=Prauserella cavernicola TaxID=2800127 RepID=A0A934V5P7_9PSEU|nr:GAF domain-containing protein [Prauserella cavernicola]MBK1785904.1 GAF domain-containing protein [Prauserella cavernicola]
MGAAEPLERHDTGSRLPAPLAASRADPVNQIGRAHQGLVDAEMRASRRMILRRFRHRLFTDPGTLAAEDFLAVADPAVVHTAILFAAQGIGETGTCDLQTVDRQTGELHLVRHRGFPPGFLGHFAVVGPKTPSACGLALATGEPVFVDDVSTSPVFADDMTRAVVLAAGTQAVQSYPLCDGDGTVLGVLSLHYPDVGQRDGRDTLVKSAALAIAHTLPDDQRLSSR